MFDNVANGCADSQRLNPKQTGDLQLSLGIWSRAWLPI